MVPGNIRRYMDIFQEYRDLSTRPGRIFRGKGKELQRRVPHKGLPPAKVHPRLLNRCQLRPSLPDFCGREAQSHGIRDQPVLSAMGMKRYEPGQGREPKSWAGHK